VEENIKLIASINSSFGICVFSLINIHLFIILLIARSRGMLVNKDITSNDISLCVLQIFVPDKVLYNSKLFLTCLWSSGKLQVITDCKYEANA